MTIKVKWKGSLSNIDKIATVLSSHRYTLHVTANLKLGNVILN